MFLLMLNAPFSENGFVLLFFILFCNRSITFSALPTDLSDSHIQLFDVISFQKSINTMLSLHFCLLKFFMTGLSIKIWFFVTCDVLQHPFCSCGRRSNCSRCFYILSATMAVGNFHRFKQAIDL